MSGHVYGGCVVVASDTRKSAQTYTADNGAIILLRHNVSLYNATYVFIVANMFF